MFSVWGIKAGQKKFLCMSIVSSIRGFKIRGELISMFFSCIEKRFTVVEVGHPWKNESVERNMQPLKYYYDLDMSKCWGEDIFLYELLYIASYICGSPG